ncbi:MAG: hypothetical protein ACTSWX_13825 [Promethearchaeota archaeon]
MSSKKIRFEWFVVCPSCKYEYSAINTSLTNYKCPLCGNYFTSSPNFRAKNDNKKIYSH